MLGLIKDRVPVGVLAYDCDESMPVIDEDAWSILCVFVRPSHRGQGLTHVLVEGAVDHAAENGARIVAAYPWDTAGLSGTGPAKHWGHSKVYAACGFNFDNGRRWVRHTNA